MQKFKFKNIYSLVSLIDESVHYGEEFWNFDIDYFLNTSTRFSKHTLLHQYIVTRALNYYSRCFRKGIDVVDDIGIEHWISLFVAYDVTEPPFDLNGDEDEEPYNWFVDNEEKFHDLFENMSDEVFYILFANRNFLIKFNLLVSKTVQQIINGSWPSEEYVDTDVRYSKNTLSHKGRIKRRAIPSWVKKAVYHRDRGRCVYCNTDLTGIINLLETKNFDHMVPLDIFGTNDPCNIQLTCEKCNKSKSNHFSSTGFKYQPWWPKEKPNTSYLFKPIIFTS